MYRIVDKKCSGKTARLLLLAKENNGIVVCAYPEWLKKKAYKYGLTGIDFISYNEFINGIEEHTKKVAMYHPDGTASVQDYVLKCYDSEKPVFVDDIELLFSRLCNLSGYTLSID
jgi:hypothetical protein